VKSKGSKARSGKSKKKKRAKKKEAPVPKGKVKVLNKGRLSIFQAVKGLSRDGGLVARIIEIERPDVVSLGIAPEELDGLRSLMKDDSEYEPDLSNIDTAYAKHLSRFGDVVAPPPCFTEAVISADVQGIPVVALDIDIEVHTDIYVKNVVFSDLLRQSMKFRWIKKKKFKIATPEEFALKWDAILNKAEGFSVVEEAREACMADSLECILEEEKVKKALAVIEIERVEGTINKYLKKIKEKSKKKRDK